MNVAARIDSAPGADWEANGWELIPGFLGPDEIALLQSESDRLCGNSALFDERGAVPNSAGGMGLVRMRAAKTRIIAPPARTRSQ